MMNEIHKQVKDILVSGEFSADAQIKAFKHVAFAVNGV